jgi:hypothetical protein
MEDVQRARIVERPRSATATTWPTCTTYRTAASELSEQGGDREAAVSTNARLGRPPPRSASAS